MATLRLATRGSPLALAQARTVAARLQQRDPSLACELVVVETSADRRVELPISAFAGQGAFVAEVELALLEHRADVAVHSAKDLPAGNAVPGLVLAAVPERIDPRDVLVGNCLEELAPGALVATGAARRRAQLAWLRPDLGFVELRGNIATRLAKRPPGGAVMVAAAALHRLGLVLEPGTFEVLETVAMLPQVGQGAIALRCRDADRPVLELLAGIDDAEAHLAVRAERAFLARLGGGCDAPVGALARVVAGTPQPGYPAVPTAGAARGRVVAAPAAASGGARVELEVLVAARDGHGVARRRGAGADPERLGARLADELLGEAGAELLLGRLGGDPRGGGR